MSSLLLNPVATPPAAALAGGKLLYGRSVQVLFGVPGTQALSFTGLRVAFQFKKTADSTPNQGQIKVWNLSRNSRLQADKKKLAIICRAGYGANAKTLFSGDVARVITDLEGADIVTTFELGDGERAYQESRTSLALARGTDLKNVLNQLAISMGKTVGDTSSIKSDRLLHGMTLHGTTREQLDVLCKRLKLTWSVQDDVVQFVALNQPNTQTAFLLSSATGLVSVPKRKKDGGIELQCLLQPEIQANRLIQLKSNFISGNFRVQTVSLTGDTHSTNFYNKIEATAYGH